MDRDLCLFVGCDNIAFDRSRRILQKQKTTYVQISPDWQGCDFLYPGWIH